MVGAGGIGCELLKNLVLSQYGEIHIVDLDTITLSNLNRQFLFRPTDIDKSKSLTVVKAVETFNYHNTKLIPHHGNIMDTNQFLIAWWDQFSYVFNALDNLEARRYVNKMCLFLKKPLMESGTTGYDGQVQPIFPYYSECFECQAKATPKTYPVCTIRSTPSQPVHCITWAKEFLFHQLFDESSSTVTTAQSKEQQRKKLQEETDDNQEIENMLKESNELSELRQLIKTPTLEDRKQFIHRTIIKIFKVDIERLLRIDSLWKTRMKPVPLQFDELYINDLNNLLSDKSNEVIISRDTLIWSLLENLYVFYKASENLQKRLNGSESFISFDKDDEDTLNFVVAAANIRCNIFNIEVKSKFDIKQIAGNIIPAIATTNAIISGFSSLGALRYYESNVENNDFENILKDSSTVFVSIRPNKYITSASLIGPGDQCPSCSLSRGLLNINDNELKIWTLKDLVDKLIQTYGYEDDVSIILGQSKLIYDFDFDDNLDKKLSEINGFRNGELLLIQDEDDMLENLELYINTNYVDSSHLPIIKLRPKKQKVETPKENEEDQYQDILTNNDAIIIDDEEELIINDHEGPDSKKRKAEPLEANGKKLKA